MVRTTFDEEAADGIQVDDDNGLVLLLTVLRSEIPAVRATKDDAFSLVLVEVGGSKEAPMTRGTRAVFNTRVG